MSQHENYGDRTEATNYLKLLLEHLGLAVPLIAGIIFAIRCAAVSKATFTLLTA
jgi:hypothetical protein